MVSLVIDTRKVKAFENKAFMSNTELAVASGMSPWTMRKFFHERYKAVRVGTVKKIAEALNVSPEELLPAGVKEMKAYLERLEERAATDQEGKDAGKRAREEADALKRLISEMEEVC